MKYVIDLPEVIVANKPFEYEDSGICLCVFDPERIKKIEDDEPFVKVGNIIIYDGDIVALILDIDIDDALTVFNENGCVETIDVEDIDEIIGSTDLVDRIIKLLRGEDAHDLLG